MDVKKKNELVLVFNEDLMYGFRGLLPKDYPESLSIHGASMIEEDIRWLKECSFRSFFMPRGLVENDSRYKQIIPYIVIVNADQVFTYQRKGTESRLTDKISIGIGGHVNVCDYCLGKTLFDTVNNAANREFREEVYVKGVSDQSQFYLYNQLMNPVGVLYAGNVGDDVNSVHFGVIYIVRLHAIAAASLILKEEGKQLDWMSLKDLKNMENLEEWSKLVVEKCL